MLNVDLVGQANSCASDCIERHAGQIVFRSYNATSWIILNYGKTMKVKRIIGDDFGWNMEFCHGDEYVKSIVDYHLRTNNLLKRANDLLREGCVGTV